MEILRAASREGATTTTLVFRTNMNYLRLGKYVELLTKRNLLERVGSHPKMYRTTAKGDEAMGILASAGALFFGNDDPPSTPAASKDRARAASAARDRSDQRQVRRGFAKLSTICKLRSGDQCGLRGGECKLESCLLFETR